MLTGSKQFYPASSLRHDEEKLLQESEIEGMDQSLWRYKWCDLVLPKVTNPAFAVRAWAGAAFNSRGGVADHIQEGALLRPAVLLASTSS